MNIVFSKNRAMQLDAFLRSSVPNAFIVLCKISPDHEASYEEVLARHPVTFDRQTDFKKNVLDLLVDEYTTFFVDDQIFLQPWDGFLTEGLSLRLGTNLTFCYPLGMPQQLPHLERYGDMYTWQWANGQFDWAYPLSLDGHTFKTSKIKPLIEKIEFHSPNSLEAQLQQFTPMFETGICYPESKVVSVPWNLVQEGYNRNAGGNADEMLAHWKAGLQIKLPKGLSSSCHQVFPLEYETRT